MEPNSINIFFTVLVAAAMLGALIGSIFPVFPGVGLAWAAALGFGFLAGWSGTSITFMAIISAIAIASLVISLVAPKRTTDGAGASRAATWGGIVGATIGFFVIPFAGFIIGGLLGVYAVEYRVTSDARLAWNATLGTLKGFGVAALIQIAAVVLIGLVWVAWATVLYV